MQKKKNCDVHIKFKTQSALSSHEYVWQIRFEVWNWRKKEKKTKKETTIR
jgi:hypothetical protein